MKHHIVGIRAVEGTSKKTGKPFDSYIVHTTVENSNEVDAGIAVKDIFIDKGLLKDAVRDLGSYKQLVGLDMDIDRNEYGFVSSVTVVY